DRSGAHEPPPHMFRQLGYDLASPLLLGSEFFGRRYVRYCRLMFQPRFRRLERGRHCEYRRTVLDGDHPPRAEAAPVTAAVDFIQNRPARITCAQEIGMQRMAEPPFNGARCGDQRLPQHLSAIDSLPAVARRDAAKEIVLDRI